MASSMLMGLAVVTAIAVMWFSESESKKRRAAWWALVLVLSGGTIVVVLSRLLGVGALSLHVHACDAGGRGAADCMIKLFHCDTFFS